MDKFNRDLLVLFKEDSNPQAIEHEVEQLHELLYHVESIENLVIAHEVVDLNKYRIFDDSKIIRQNLNRRKLRAFIFLNNKN